MALRAKKPEAVTKRLKLFMFGPAGVGKTTACCQLPKPYIIDGEKGTENYSELIQSVGGAVLQTTDMEEVIAEVKSLLTVQHEYKTLVVDPLTPIYNDLLDKCEGKVGADFGRHYGAANKYMKRLVNLLMALDMNVVITSHAKVEYGDNLKKLGFTFDCWKSADYIFDLVIELSKKGKKRFGRVQKTRVAGFPEDDIFEWSYEVLKERCGGTLDLAANAVELASPEQVAQITELVGLVKLPEDTVEKWFKKVSIDRFEDMPADAIVKCIEWVQGRMPAVAAR